MKSSKKKGKILKNNYPFVMIIIAMTMISSGLYLNYHTNPKILLSKTFNNLIKIVENTKSNEDITGISENFTLNSNIKFNIGNQSIQKSIDTKDTQNKNLITNLNNTTTNLTLVQDKTNKKMYASINSKLGQEELINAKYLVENATEYYYVKDIVNNYVNNGNSGYFEALNSATTTKENIIYILKITSKSLEKRLKNEYFTTTKEQTLLNNKIKKLNKISLKLTDTTTKELVNNIIIDLKEDKKANQILTSLDKNFFKNIIDSENKIFNYNEIITINMYITNLGNIKKYELIYLNKEKENKLTYEVETEQIYYIENNQIIYDIKYESSEDEKNLIFYNVQGEEQGKIVYDKTINRTLINGNLKRKSDIIDIIYDSSIEDIEKNISYTNKINFLLKVSSPTGNIVNTTININNNIKSSTMINEDTTASVFASSLTEDEEKLLNNKLSNTYMRLSN